jgi:hypothetical protein
MTSEKNPETNGSAYSYTFDTDASCGTHDGGHGRAHRPSRHGLMLLLRRPPPPHRRDVPERRLFRRHTIEGLHVRYGIRLRRHTAISKGPPGGSLHWQFQNHRLGLQLHQPWRSRHRLSVQPALGRLLPRAGHLLAAARPARRADPQHGRQHPQLDLRARRRRPRQHRLLIHRDPAESRHRHVV